MPVLVRINGVPRPQPWRTNMMPLGDGSFRLYLQTTVRRVPQHPMPAWFRRPLRANPKAWAAYQALTPSRKKEILRYLAQLKSPDARKRNVARALRALAGQPVRYMARSW